MTSKKYRDLLSKHVQWRDLVLGEIRSATSINQQYKVIRKQDNFQTDYIGNRATLYEKKEYKQKITKFLRNRHQLSFFSPKSHYTLFLSHANVYR